MPVLLVKKQARKENKAFFALFSYVGAGVSRHLGRRTSSVSKPDRQAFESQVPFPIFCLARTILSRHQRQVARDAEPPERETAAGAGGGGREEGRMCCCRCCCWSLPLKWRAGLLFLMPLVYGGLLLGVVLGRSPPVASKPIFSVSCLVLASANLLTFVVGELGVFLRVEAALRATVVLLIMESLLAFLGSAFVSAFCIYEALNPKPLSRHWLLKQSVGATATASAAVMLLSLLSLCSLWLVAEYQADLDAEAFVVDANKLRDKERQALLGRKRRSKETDGGSSTSTSRRRSQLQQLGLSLDDPRAKSQDERMLSIPIDPEP
ncbi:hypothetical protein Esti_005075 [Eimeria stiedai]